MIDPIHARDRIRHALLTELLSEEQIYQLAENVHLGHYTVTDAEVCPILVPILLWAIETLENSALLDGALEGRLLISVENGEVIFGNPQDVAQ